MTLTKQQIEWLRDIKRRCVRDYAAQHGLVRDLGRAKSDGYKNWDTWKLADLCLRMNEKKRSAE